MQTYVKTFWKNEHGIEVPIALEDWPRKAMFLTVDKNGRMMYWTVKPCFHDNFDWCSGGGKLVGDQESEKIGGVNHIWAKPC